MTTPAPAARPDASETFRETFRRLHGRAPRILHIGNIANNAYLNAKLLNEAGYDCDVICADYYHIMSCPEWEDADFAGDIGDQFRPDWTRVDLRGFQRPRWFAQGPQATCLEYLIATRTGDTGTADRRWHELGLENRTTGGPSEVDDSAAVAVLRIRRLFATMRRYVRMAFQRSDAYELALAKLSAWEHRGGIPARIGRLLILPVVWVTFLPHRLARLVTPPPGRKWTRLYADTFLDRDDPFPEKDADPYVSVTPQWRALLALYDVVVAYATAGSYCLFAETPYFAFEHGTIREIPYRPTTEGRLAALTYRLATHVFVTNFDCLGSAQYLAPGRFTLINHPFDEDHGLSVTGWEGQRAQLLQELDSDFLVFFPTRQDWVSGTGYADKGNDIFLRAFGALRAQGHRVGMVCCTWGANVAESRSLLESLGCARNVTWGPPLPTIQFERMCRAAHLVVDQFILGAFGGVLFKAIAVGAPILTYLDEAQLSRQFPECPPVINCRTEPEVVDALTRLISDTARLAEVGAASRRWMQTYHGKAKTIRLQTDQFLAVLRSRTAPAERPAPAPDS